MIGIVATRHRATREVGRFSQAVVMIAVHRNGRRLCGIARLIVMVVDGAHAAGAAVRLVGLQGCSPRGSPEEENGEQAEGCGQFLSRSDRKVERESHASDNKFYTS